MKIHLTLVALATTAALAVPLPAAAEVGIETMLAAFVEDFRTDPASNVDITFAVRVKDEGEWHVVVRQAKDGGDRGTVELATGLPAAPSLVFVTDRDTLERIHDRRMAIFTAMGKGESSDFAPMDVEAMEGFQPGPGFGETIVPFIFHFWTMGDPEIISFGAKSLTRLLHGGNAVLFYYQKGFRSGWFMIEKGQHVNEEPDDQVNPFPSMIAMTGGRATARIGDKTITLEKGQTLFVPAGVAHELWNEEEEPAEGILMMFGEGA